MTADLSLSSFLPSLGAGMVGGLILNIMPCVLPGLFMKARHVIALLQSGQSNASQRADGLAYLGGSLLTFTIYGAIVIMFKASGQSLGWGMQMKDPLFVGGLMVATLLFALASFDVLEFNLGVGYSALGKSSQLRSFLDGIFITLISTPCSAPILGGAVTIALAQDSAWWQTLTLFWSIGFGLCLPVLIISFIPRASRFVPRTGPWMDHFKTFVGVTLLMACVWLYTTYESLLPTPGHSIKILYALCALAGIAVLMPIWHKSALVTRSIFNILALSGMCGALWWASQAPVEHLDWRPYTHEARDAHLKTGAPVFVDFTADWCLSCKAFESIYLNNPSTATLFRTHNVLALQADMTKADFTDKSNVLAKLLMSFNRSGIPAYVVYHPDGRVDLLPEGPPLTLAERVQSTR